MPPKKLTKRQASAFDPENMVEKMPGLPSNFEELKQRIVAGFTDPKEAQGVGGGAKKQVGAKDMDVLSRDVEMQANPMGLSSREIQALNDLEKQKEQEAKMQVLREKAKMMQEPVVNPMMDTAPEREAQQAFDTAVQKDPRLANPENKRRFMDIMNRTKK